MAIPADHVLYKLTDYPTLALQARRRTTATRLDDMECRFICEDAISTMDLATVRDKDRLLMRSLDVEPPI
jgi:hypothetical protein